MTSDIDLCDGIVGNLLKVSWRYIIDVVVVIHWRWWWPDPAIVVIFCWYGDDWLMVTYCCWPDERTVTLSYWWKRYSENWYSICWVIRWLLTSVVLLFTLCDTVTDWRYSTVVVLPLLLIYWWLLEVTDWWWRWLLVLWWRWLLTYCPELLIVDLTVDDIVIVKA